MLQLPRGSPVGGGAALSPRPVARLRPGPAAIWGWSQGSPGPARWDRARVDPAAPPTPGCPGHPQPGAVTPPAPPRRSHLGVCGGSPWSRSFRFPPLPSRFPAVGWGVLCSVSLQLRGAGGSPEPAPSLQCPPLLLVWPLAGARVPPAVAGDGGGGDTSAVLMEPVRSLPSPRPLCGSAAAAGRAPCPLLPPQCPPVRPLPPPVHPGPLPEASSPPSCRGSSRGAAAAGRSCAPQIQDLRGRKAGKMQHKRVLAPEIQSGARWGGCSWCEPPPPFRLGTPGPPGLQ